MGGDSAVVGEVWAGIRVAVVLTKEGLGHALPSSNMYDELLLSAKPSILPTLYPLPFPITYSQPFPFLDQSEAWKNLSNRRALQNIQTN